MSRTPGKEKLNKAEKVNLKAEKPEGFTFFIDACLPACAGNLTVGGRMYKGQSVVIRRMEEGILLGTTIF